MNDGFDDNTSVDDLPSTVKAGNSASWAGAELRRITLMVTDDNQ